MVCAGRTTWSEATAPLSFSGGILVGRARNILSPGLDCQGYSGFLWQVNHALALAGASEMDSVSRLYSSDRAQVFFLFLLVFKAGLPDTWI